MKTANLMLLSLILSCSAFAQDSLNLDPGTICSWNEAAIIPGDLRSFPPDKETQAAVDKIMKYTGLQVNFALVAANVPTAVAAMDGNRRVILYNQSFMRQIVQETGTDWAATSILAHEIAHHLVFTLSVSEAIALNRRWRLIAFPEISHSKWVQREQSEGGAMGS